MIRTSGGRGTYGSPSQPHGSTYPTPAQPTVTTLQWVLRIGVFMCFLGHGSFAIMAKPEWASFFSVVGIPPAVGFHLMPWIGLLDITIAAFALASPRPIVFLWAAIWCTWTATLRPLTGLGMWEFWVRACNYGIPLALLALRAWPRPWREWVAPIRPGPVTADRLWVSSLVVRLAVALSLIGHAGLSAFQQNAELLDMYARVGLPASIEGIRLAVALGWFELLLAAAVLLRPFRGLLLFVCVYRVMGGLLHPATGGVWWEFIERGADYAAPVGLILLGDALATERARAGARIPVAEALPVTPTNPVTPVTH